MTDEHDHPHDHGDGCCSLHSPGGDDGGPEFTDPAGRHLAAALKTSFRVLTGIMALGVVGFLALGFSFVEPGEVAIRTVFGRVVGTTPEGLAYNWPAPIGRIEKVKVGERTIRIDDFWMNETPDELKQPDLRKRRMPPGGLVPGWDGALLTGDRNLLHVRLECTYAIRRQWDRGREADPVLQFRRNVQDANASVQAAVSAAAIRAAATRTADGLQSTQRGEFESQVRRLTQQGLDELGSGLGVRTVKVTRSVWPLRTLPDYDAAQKAVQDAQQAHNHELGVAVRLLNAAAGPTAAEKLVGSLADVTGTGGPAETRAGEDYNLLGQYARAVEAGDRDAAAGLLERIDNVLVGESGGQVSRILNEAKSQRTTMIQAIEKRVLDFEQRLPEFLKAPEFTIRREWDRTREKILAMPTVEKYYITPGGGKTVLKVNRDPDVARQVDREMLRLRRGSHSATDAGTK
jgi:regulator of protease activity HflC (stomatin/prohibitin superfamily)